MHKLQVSIFANGPTELFVYDLLGIYIDPLTQNVEIDVIDVPRPSSVLTVAKPKIIQLKFCLVFLPFTPYKTNQPIGNVKEYSK